MTTIPKQIKTYGPRSATSYGLTGKITAIVRFDDSCGNGHNTFSVAGRVTDHATELAGGCLHDEIAVAFPELAHMIRWHLVSTDGPLHYVENTLYWLGYRGYCTGEAKDPPNLDNAKRSACWPDMPADLIANESVRVKDTCLKKYGGNVRELLLARLPSLMTAFRREIETLGLQWSGES